MSVFGALPRLGFLLLLCAAIGCAGKGAAPQADAPLGVGWHAWTDLIVNPVDPRNLVACGARWLPQHNVMHSFVYASFDEGRTWKLSLIDSASDWVTEQSCAFGPRGELYFNSEASQTFDGDTHHNLGQLHLYRSDDAGKTWTLPIVDGWFDHSAMAISKGGTVFLFANCSVSDREYNPTCAAPALRRLFRNGTSLMTMIELPPTASHDYEGAYPSAVRMLRNGRVLAVMYARHKSYSDGKVFGLSPFTVDVVWWNPGDRYLSGPGIVGRNQGCGGNMPAMDVDRSNDAHSGRVYVTWSKAVRLGPASWDQGAPCIANLSYSDDAGRTWKTAPIPGSGTGGMPVVAVSRSGVLGVAWRNAGGCWYFAFSRDGGKHFSAPAALLHTCRSFRRSTPGILSTVPFYEASSTSDIFSFGSFGFTVRSDEGDDWRSNMAAGGDGAFHVVWPDLGSGHLYVSSINIDNLRPVARIRTEELTPQASSDQSDEAAPPPSPTPVTSYTGLRKVSTAIGLTFDGATYDASERTVTVFVHLINQGNVPLMGPFVLALERVGSDFGQAQLIGPRGAKAIDVTNAVQGGVLLPFQASRAAALSFRIDHLKLPSHRYDDRFVSVKADVWANLPSPTLH